MINVDILNETVWAIADMSPARCGWKPYPRS